MNSTLQQPDTLSAWLSYIEAMHPSQIDMGLDRVAKVYNNLNLDFGHAQIILVAGTNGKGSTCRLLELFARANGLRAGVYSSPHISDYRERVRIDDGLLSEALHCVAFARVEAARGSTSLTYFEFATLAALTLLADAKLDALILEVGLGGRLDAVNIVEPDLSIITTIDLDHQAWLGDTRELVGYEKAGIMRSGKPCVIGELAIPESVLTHGKQISANTFCRNVDFFVQEDDQHWHFSAKTAQGEIDFSDLPKGRLPIQNAATALYSSLALGWSPSVSTIREILANATLPGRLERLSHAPQVIVDVAHNPQATRYLRNQLESIPHCRLIFVLGMLSDKDSQASLEAFADVVATWYIAPLDCARSAKAEVLESALVDSGQQTVVCHSIADAYSRALEEAMNPQDLIIGFGSFYTVAEIKQAAATKAPE